MVNRIRLYLNAKRFGPATLAAVAVAFLLVGTGVAADLHGIGVAAPAGIDTGTTKREAPARHPGSLADLAKALGPTVVHVKVTKVERVSAFPFRWPEGLRGNMPQLPERFNRQGAGSGVIVGRDGYILTNNHVVEGATEVTVTLTDKEEYTARIVGRDPKTDLAVLKIDAKTPLAVAAMGDSDTLEVGDWVVAIGNPFGLTNTVTAGIVSAKGRIIGAGPYDDFIQTDASINPGNSGGPLFNLRGEVIGINTAINAMGQGIGFAIPINIVKPLIPQMVATGEVTRGYLGVSLQPITAGLAKGLALQDRSGALVGDVVSGSPADKAGIRRGDVIVAFNNKAVERVHDLPAVVAGTPVGQETVVTLLRDGAKHELSVTVGKLASETPKDEEPTGPERGKWGLLLQDITPQLAGQLGLKDKEGVMVAGVQPGTPADAAGMRRGDVILEVNRRPARSVEQVIEVMTNAGEEDVLVLLVKRDRGSFFATLERKS